jgi:hypothetical protein
MRCRGSSRRRWRSSSRSTRPRARPLSSSTSGPRVSTRLAARCTLSTASCRSALPFPLPEPLSPPPQSVDHYKAAAHLVHSAEESEGNPKRAKSDDAEAAGKSASKRALAVLLTHVTVGEACANVDLVCNCPSLGVVICLSVTSVCSVHGCCHVRY